MLLQMTRILAPRVVTGVASASECHRAMVLITSPVESGWWRQARIIIILACWRYSDDDHPCWLRLAIDNAAAVRAGTEAIEKRTTSPDAVHTSPFVFGVSQSHHLGAEASAISETLTSV